MQPLYQKEKAMLVFSIMLISLPLIIMVFQSIIAFVTAQGLYINLIIPAEFFFIIFIGALLQFLVAMTIKYKAKEVIIIDLLIGALYFLILLVPMITGTSIDDISSTLLLVIMMIILIIYNACLLYAIRLNLQLYKHLLSKG